MQVGFSRRKLLWTIITLLINLGLHETEKSHVCQKAIGVITVALSIQFVMTGSMYM